MNPNIQTLIETQYNFKILKSTSGPRQFVAETFILETDKEKYFLKITDKPLFISEIKVALPAHRALYDSGFTRINYPIKTSDNKLFLENEGKLIVLYNFIDLPQNYEYSTEELGRTLAEIHNIELPDESIAQKDKFQFASIEQLHSSFEISLGYDGKDEILLKLSVLMKKYEEFNRNMIKQFLEFSEEIKKQDVPFVITHGDAGGNTLFKKGEPIQIIDWDCLLLAAPERDIWNFYFDENFMKGYKFVRPDYEISILRLRYYIFYYYITALTSYLAEIMSDKSLVHREKNLELIEFNLFEGWMKPILKQMEAL